MLTFAEITSHQWLLVVFFIVSLSLCCLMLIFGWLLGGRSNAKHKNVPFESGIDPIGSARLRVSVKFYLMAVFFVIFDVEALYLFAWSISIRETNWISFIEVLIFVLILLIGLFYLSRIGGLDWTPIRSCHEKKETMQKNISNHHNSG